MLYTSICLVSENRGTPTSFRAPPLRKGAVLLIVLVLLVLFATVGLAFMFYAESESANSQAFREIQDFRGPDIDPDLAFSMFLQQLIFDCRDDASGIYSALRGHSLFRNMYALNYNFNSGQSGPISLFTGSTKQDQLANITPFNGTGRLHWSYGATGLPAAPQPPSLWGSSGQTLIDDYYLVNYTYFPNSNSTYNFLRDPERFGTRAGPTAARQPFIGGFNPGYTAADYNCMALAAVKADGTLLVPSFHRSWWGFGASATSGTLNQNWFTADPSNGQTPLKYQVLRPRPADHPPWPNPINNGVTLPGFPAPEADGYDVRNRPPSWGPSDTSYNDSFWLYTGAPIYTLPDGRQYTLLFAPFMIDLDSKLNLNVAGNIRGLNSGVAGATFLSNQGWGPWEMNPTRLSPSQTATMIAEWNNLFKGDAVPTTTTTRLPGKYQPTWTTTSATSFDTTTSTTTQPEKPPHFYAQVDYDAATGWTLSIRTVAGRTVTTLKGGKATAQWTPPTGGTPTGGLKAGQAWPLFTAGFENLGAPATHLANNTNFPTELQTHPSLYGPTSAVTGSRVFLPNEMHKILNFGGTGSDALQSDLWQLMPMNFTDPTVGSSLSTAPNGTRVRNMVTTYSFDRWESPLTPYLYDPSKLNANTGTNYYQLPIFNAGNSSQQQPVGQVTIGTQPAVTYLSFPPLSDFTNSQTATGNALTATTRLGQEFDASWRGQPSSLTFRSTLPTNSSTSASAASNTQPTVLAYPVKIDLNRTLTPYPWPNFSSTANPSGTNRIDWLGTSGSATANQTAFNKAVQDRQNFAMDLFNVLRMVTGAYDPSNPASVYGQIGNERVAKAYSTAHGTGPKATPIRYRGNTLQQQVDALRYLAQLAVNIVDFIDEDDYITPFNWTQAFTFNTAPNNAQVPTGLTNAQVTAWKNNCAAFITDQNNYNDNFVYGTEIPKLVINEVYAEYDNGTPAGIAPNKYLSSYEVNVWAELCNPFTAEPTATSTLVDNGSARMYIPASSSQPAITPYLLAVTAGNPPNGTVLDQNTWLHAPQNSLGLPDAWFTQPPTQAVPLSTPPYVPPYPGATANTKPGALNQVVGIASTPEWASITGAVVTPLSSMTTTTTTTTTPPIETTTATTTSVGFASPTFQGSNSGFLLVGPGKTGAGGAVTPVAFQGAGTSSLTNQVPKASVSSTAMRYAWSIPGAGGTGGTGVPTTPTLVLQRLLCPYLPYNTKQPILSTDLPYNPYITVDYFDASKATGFNGMNVAANRNGVPSATPNVTRTAVQGRYSVGRVQPYQGSAIQKQQYQTAPTSTQTYPQTTFFQLNTPSGQAGQYQPPLWLQLGTAPAVPTNTTNPFPTYNWLTQLDRKLISPMELLHVSGYRPHELTQNFTGQFNAMGTSGTTAHQAPWFSNASRLYRFFDFVQTLPRGAGITTRVPGKININTIWDQEIFNALCDPPASGNGPHFSATDVSTAWQNLLSLRNPGNSGANPSIPVGSPGPFDRYFLPLSTGYTGAGDVQSVYTNRGYLGKGIEDTVLRPSSLNASTRLFEPAQSSNVTDPFSRYEMLNKIYNNFTTRSNTFAVWVTVGFFQVNAVVPQGNNGNRIYLGQEMGRAEGRQIRHRMFGVIDRSQIDLTATGTTSATSPNWLNTVQGVLNQTIEFNPHSSVFQTVIPYYAVIE
jgi:hypothetical protein